MALLNKSDLTHYLELNYNVLFRGRHGVGKTAIIREIFDKAGIRWRYFSASTLDPWIDFVGMPRVVDKPDGTQELKLIRPSFIEHDEVDAIFFDEYNRAPDKVLNATMELIQFGSINGHKLKNLKVIWAAINPEDEEDTYSVNHLDPAHIDRFQVQIDVPYKVDPDYFLTKYPTTGRLFMDWWNGLPTDISFLVSPRRLDFAADAHRNKCRLEDFLPHESNIKALRDVLKSLPLIEQLKNIKNTNEAIIFLRDFNNAQRVLDLVKASDSTAVKFFTDFGSTLPKELSDPVKDYLQARRAGFTIFDSLEELIAKIPGDRGTSATGAMLNNVDLQRMFARTGGNLDNDLLALQKTQRPLVTKLINRVADILLSCQTDTIMRLFWGAGGRDENRPSNLQVIAMALSKLPENFSVKQKNEINNKLYRNKIVSAQAFL